MNEFIVNIFVIYRFLLSHLFPISVLDLKKNNKQLFDCETKVKVFSATVKIMEQNILGKCGTV